MVDGLTTTVLDFRTQKVLRNLLFGAGEQKAQLVASIFCPKSAPAASIRYLPTHTSSWGT